MFTPSTQMIYVSYSHFIVFSAELSELFFIHLLHKCFMITSRLLFVYGPSVVKKKGVTKTKARQLMNSVEAICSDVYRPLSYIGR